MLVLVFVFDGVDVDVDGFDAGIDDGCVFIVRLAFVLAFAFC